MALATVKPLIVWATFFTILRSFAAEIEARNPSGRH
jgi:hypothetical protein